MSLFRKLLGQTALYGISSILGRMLNTFILTPYHTRQFGVGGFGLFNAWYSYISFWNVILTFGMETSFFRFMKEKEGDPAVYRQAFRWVLGISSLVLLLIAGVVGYLFAHGASYLPLLIIGCVLWLDAVAALPLAQLRYQEKAKDFALINLSNIAATIVGNWIFVGYFQMGPLGALCANLLASLLRLLLALRGNLPQKVAPNPELMRQMWHYGGFIMLAGVAGMMNETLDRALIPHLWTDGQRYHNLARTGQEMNGLYAAGYRFGIFLALFTQAFRYALEPFFFKKAKDKESPKTFAMIFHYFILFCLVGFLLISSFVYELVSVEVFGYQFIHKSLWEGLEVAPVILLAYVFAAAYTQISVWFKVTGMAHYALRFTGAGALLTVAINVLGVPSYGYWASALATLLCYVVMTIWVYWEGQKHYPVPYNIPKILVHLTIVLMGYCVCLVIGHSDWLHTSYKAGLLLLCLLLMVALEYKDFQRLRTIIPKQN